MKNIWKQFLKNEGGALFIYLALAIIPILGFIGLSVDMGRAYHAQAIIEGAVDAATMAAARVDPADAQAEANRVFNAYIDGTSVAGHAQIDSVVVNEAEGYVEVHAMSNVEMMFLKIIGEDSLTVEGKSRVLTGGGVVEVAVVLDNTGSMEQRISGQKKIDILKDATDLLIETLFEDGDQPDDLFVSIVPYITQVNVGTRTGWLTASGLATVNDPSKFPNKLWGNWQGCLEARLTDDLHKSDTPPTTEATKFTPYWWPSTRVHNYPYPSGSIRPWGFLPGDNDWTETGLTSWNSQNPRNPNAGCPVETIPLTNVKDDLLAKNQEMIPITRGGTHIFTGLKAGFWTISPKWRGLWHSPNPYDLPKDYNKSKKVLVLMTDGYNQWIGSWAPNIFYRDKHYTAYGRWYGAAHSGLNQNVVTPNTMNDYTLEICDAVKAEGIQIYTITFGVSNQASRNTMQACASTPAQYFDAQSAVELTEAFKEIAADIGQLRYSWPKIQQQ